MPDRSATAEPGEDRAQGTAGTPGAPPASGTADQPLAFHDLVFQPDGDEVTVGRLDAGSFVVLPADGAALLRRLVEGSTCAEAARWYSATYGETVDIADFVADLGELGFLRPPGEKDAAPPPPVRWQRLGRAVFSPVGAVLYLLLIAGWLVTTVRSPDLAPSYRHVFFTHYMSVLVATMFFAQAPLILLHEAAHALAGRRLGLRSKLSVGRRLYYVVAQTTMDGLVAVPRRKRVLPILAGMLTDIGVLAAFTLVAAATRTADGDFSLIGGVALGLAYSTVLRLVWQCFFFLQTDVYYLVVTVLGCLDLQATAKQLLANRWSRLWGRPARHDPRNWHPRDRSAARWYSVLMGVGYAFALATMAVNLPPIISRAFHTVVTHLSGGPAHQWAGLADSVVFLLMVVGELGLAGALYLRERRAGRRAATTWSPS
ncbi:MULTISPECIES: hypothetical protein [unclassified Streptomyces]|uniref:hypothetical protein n=1 Tax=unclassified Streptomyces TaxID=2593676 RepID=UPI002E292EBD|nr:hypothetical protein [Streptomyces sp. NBC_00223]